VLHSSPFKQISSIPDGKVSTHCSRDSSIVKSRALVLYEQTPRRAKRRTEVELLPEDWRSLPFFKRRKYEPVVEEFGSTTSEKVRRSRRIYWCGLLKRS